MKEVEYWVVMFECYEERDDRDLLDGRFRVLDEIPIKVFSSYRKAFRYIQNYDMSKHIPSEKRFLSDVLESNQRSLTLRFDDFDVVYSLRLHAIFEEG